MTERVVNIAANRHLLRSGEGVYIGRGGGRTRLLPSDWANPYPVTETRSREQAIELFRGYAERRLRLTPSWLEPLRGKVLVCHCEPLACHGDVLVELIERTAPNA